MRGAQPQDFWDKIFCNNSERQNYCLSCSLLTSWKQYLHWCRRCFKWKHSKPNHVGQTMGSWIRRALNHPVLTWKVGSLDRWCHCCWEINIIFLVQKWLPSIHSSSTRIKSPSCWRSFCLYNPKGRNTPGFVDLQSILMPQWEFGTGNVQIMPSNHVAKMMVVERGKWNSQPCRKKKVQLDLVVMPVKVKGLWTTSLWIVSSSIIWCQSLVSRVGRNSHELVP